jgi:hypothetical protein
MLRLVLAGKVTARHHSNAERTAMGYARAAFAAGIAVGFIAGSRAGRQQYDRIVKYSRIVITSPPAQRAGHAISAKASDLAKSAAARASKTADDSAKKARDRVVKVNVPRMPKSTTRTGKPGWRSRTGHPDVPPVPTEPSVNSGRKNTHHD